MNREERRRINGPAGDLPNTKSDFDAFEEDEYRKARFDDVISDNSRVQEAYEVIKDSLGEEVADALLNYDVEGYGNGERLIDAITVLFSDHDTRRRRLNREATIRNYKDEINTMKRTPKPMIPESAEIPFNGMSVANMRFLGEGINDGYEPMSDEDINAQHNGWWFSCVGLEQDGLTVEIQFPNADNVDFDSSRVLWFSKSEYARNPYGLVENNDVWLSPDIRDDVYSAANRCLDLLSDGEEKVFKTPEEFRDWLYGQDQIPNGYDNDGYDSMDDNALPEDF